MKNRHGKVYPNINVLNAYKGITPKLNQYAYKG